LEQLFALTILYSHPKFWAKVAPVIFTVSIQEGEMKLFILAAAAAAGEASSQARLMMRRMDNVYPLMPISNTSLHTNVFQECAHFLAFLVNVAPMNRRIQLNFEDCQFKNLATKKRSLCVTGSSSPESSMGPFCVTRPNPTQGQL